MSAMEPAQKAIIAPPSPYLQVATPPNSPLQQSPSRSAGEDDRKGLLVNAIRKELADQVSAEPYAPPPEGLQPTLNLDRLTQLLKVSSDFTSHSSKSTVAAIGPPSTPQTSHQGSVAMGDARELIGLSVLSPSGPNAYADWSSAAANHRLLEGSQTNTIPGSTPSDLVTMGQLKELFMALLERKPQPPAPSVLAPEDAENAEDAAEGPEPDSKESWKYTRPLISLGTFETNHKIVGTKEQPGTRS